MVCEEFRVPGSIVAEYKRPNLRFRARVLARSGLSSGRNLFASIQSANAPTLIPLYESAGMKVDWS